MSNAPQCSAIRPLAQRKMWTSFQAMALPVAGMPGGNGGAGVGAVGLDPDGDQVAVGEDRAEGRGDVGEGGPHCLHRRDQLLPAALADAWDVVVEVVVGQQVVRDGGVALGHQAAVQPPDQLGVAVSRRHRASRFLAPIPLWPVWPPRGPARG